MAGYDDPAAAARAIAAARAVRAGRAIWDRDGVLFHEPCRHEPLVGALRGISRTRSGRLGVVDFGGGLGSTWWQHRADLQEFDVTWRIVERAELVEAGQREFSDAVLSFHRTLTEAMRAGQADVLLLSSVLSYLGNPHGLLAEVVAWRPTDLIIDRTPFVVGGRDRLVVQVAPPELGGGYYPCWLFDRPGLVASLGAHYQLVETWPVEFDRADADVPFFGLHFRLRSPAESREGVCCP